jgi:hypothetical protein
MRDGGQKKAPPRFPREGLRAARGWATKGAGATRRREPAPFEVSSTCDAERRRPKATAHREFFVG